MKILGIDTSTAVASAALVEDGRLIFEEARPAALGSSGTHHANHAETLLPLIDRILKQAALSLCDLSAIAVSIGPGSFTGLRIGLSTVKGLAYGWSVSIVGVPTLLAIAARVTGWDGLICPLLDARKKEVYAALFSKKGEKLERLTEDMVLSPGQVVQTLRSRNGSEPCLFIGDGTKAYGDLIKTALGEKCLFTLGERYPTIASAVARLGEERLRVAEPDPPGTLTPVYLRACEAEVKRERREQPSAGDLPAALTKEIS